MMHHDNSDEHIDWSLTTWEGSRREQLRRWAALPLERIVAALEEMQELSRMPPVGQPADPRPPYGAHDAKAKRSSS